MADGLRHGDAWEHAYVSAPAGRGSLAAMCGCRPGQGEANPGTVRDAAGVRSGMTAIFDTMADMPGDAGGEDGVEGLGWPADDPFHRSAERVGRDLDRNEVVRHLGRLGQGGSVVKAGALEKLTAEGISQVDRRYMFEISATWRPSCSRSTPARHGGRVPAPWVNHDAMTAAVSESRGFISARHRAETGI